MPSAPPFSGQAPLPTPSQQPHPVFTQQRTPRIPLPPPDPSQQRLNTPFKRRIGLATLASCSTGIFLGTSHGAQTAALRFRAENSHRLPTTKRGWYLYHKSKNYYVTKESLKEGLRMARKLGFWTGLYFVTEEVIDRGRVGRAYLAGDVDAKGAKERRRKDVGSSVTAGLVTSAGFSAWSWCLVLSSRQIWGLTV